MPPTRRLLQKKEESNAPVVTAVPAGWTPDRQDAADTAATTEDEESEAPVVTAVPAGWTLDREDAADTLLRPGKRDFEGQAAATTEDEESAAPVVTAVSAVGIQDT